jgi:hypothetical protein
MHKVLQFPQFPLVRISHLPWVTESDLSQEVTIRRATPAFAHQWGGPVTRAFLEHAKRAGFIHPNSIVMAQVSPFVMGAGSTPPYWHFDYTQGHGPTEDDDTFWPAAYDHTGLIMCAFDTAQHPVNTSPSKTPPAVSKVDGSTGTTGRSRANWQHAQTSRFVPCGRIRSTSTRQAMSTAYPS